jgi:hypothetical protein
MKYKLCSPSLFVGSGFEWIECDELPRFADTIRYQHTPSGEIKEFCVESVVRIIGEESGEPAETSIEVWVQEVEES